MNFKILSILLLFTSTAFSMESEQHYVQQIAQEFNIKTNAHTREQALFDARLQLSKLHNPNQLPNIISNGCLTIAGGTIGYYSLIVLYMSLMSAILGYEASKKPSMEGAQKLGYLTSGILSLIGLTGTLCGGACMAFGIHGLGKYLFSNTLEIQKYDQYITALENMYLGKK